MQICTAPSRVPAAWRAADFDADKRWIYELSASDIDELEAALHQAKQQKRGVPDIRATDFPLRNLATKLSQLLEEVENGLGIVLLRGLPVERYSKQDAGTIFWGIGTHLGRAIAQNAYGDVLGHVRDLGKDWTTDMNARGYQTTFHLPFHNELV